MEMIAVETESEWARWEQPAGIAQHARTCRGMLERQQEREDEREGEFQGKWNKLE